MYELSLVVGSESLVLHGPLAAGALRGARYAPGAAEGDEVNERLELALEGTQEQLDEALGRLGRLLGLAKAAAGSANAEWGYLCAAAVPGSSWRSRLLAGWLEFPENGGAARVRGRLAVLLHVRRAAWWEGSETSLPLSSLHGSRVTAGLAWTNHNDGGHASTAFIAGEDIAGDQPAPARLELSAATTAAGTVWVGLNQGSDPAGLPSSLQAEAAAPGSGVTGSVAADGAASGGQLLNLAWAGSDSTTLASWALSPTLLAGLGGRAFFSLLRLGALPLESTLWAWWRLTYTATSKVTVWEGAGRYLSTSSLEQELGALALPPWRSPAGLASPALQLELMAQGQGGAHALSLDELLLLPMDGWRKYSPLLAAGQSLGLRDDSERGVLLGLANALPTHAAEGPGFWLRPGRAAQLVLALSQGAASSTAVTGAIQVFYRPRRAWL